MESNKGSSIELQHGLILRILDLSDAESFYNLYKKNYEAKPPEESPLQPGETPVDFTARILGLCTHIWTIRLSDDPETIVGDAALHDWNQEDSTIEIGGSLLPHYQGQGIMPAVFGFIFAFATEQLNIKAIIGRTGLNNQQATSMVLKMGFKRVNESDGVDIFEKLLQ